MVILLLKNISAIMQSIATNGNSDALYKITSLYSFLLTLLLPQLSTNQKP